MVDKIVVKKFDGRFPRQHRGFTLLELMIVVVVVAILASIAYPAYQEQVRKSRRSDAKNALADLASRQQQYFADNKTYADTLAKLNWNANKKSPQGYYDISEPIVVTTGGVNVSFELTATANGAQASDVKCNVLKINSAGKKWTTSVGTDCW